MKLPVVKYWSRSSGCASASSTSCTSSGWRDSATRPATPWPTAIRDPCRDVRRDPGGRGEVEKSRLGRAQHERAALRLHVRAHQRQQSVGQLARIARLRVERQDAIEEIERAGSLAQRLAAAMQLDVRLLQLPDGHRELFLELPRPADGAPHLLGRRGGGTLHRDLDGRASLGHAGRRRRAPPPAPVPARPAVAHTRRARAASRPPASALPPRAPRDRRSARTPARRAPRPARNRSSVACPEELSRLVQREHGGELSVHAQPA